MWEKNCNRVTLKQVPNSEPLNITISSFSYKEPKTPFMGYKMTVSICTTVFTMFAEEVKDISSFLLKD